MGSRSCLSRLLSNNLGIYGGLGSSGFGQRPTGTLFNNSLAFSAVNQRFHYQRVQWFRIGNTEVPNHKRLMIGLQSIHGIGRNRAHQILCELNITNKFTKDLTGLELNNLREEISKYITGEDLKRLVDRDIQRLKEIQCYRGYRHIHGLPCRGQRTSTNARTRKAKQPRTSAGTPGKNKRSR